MAIKNIGYTTKSSSGKSTIVRFNLGELIELAEKQRQERITYLEKNGTEDQKQKFKDNEEKYGKQVTVMISGDVQGEYGHNVFTIADDEEKKKDDLPF